MDNENAAVVPADSAGEAYRPKVGDPANIPAWNATLKAYMDGKAALDKRIIASEEFYRLRHWKLTQPADGSPDPASGWLVNVILSKHSDAVDAYPESNYLPREKGDVEEAKSLSKIIPVVKAENDYERTWSDKWWDKLKAGTTATGVFWDGTKHNGLGDISITHTEILNLAWEPGIKDLQESQKLFCVDLVDNAVLEQQYPQLAGQLVGNPDSLVKVYRYDESIKTDGKSYVVDMYYKVRGQLHLIKYVQDFVLVCTEDDPATYPNGLYDHGKYPFVLDGLYPEKGYPRGVGYGIVDLIKDAQTVADALNNALTEATVAGATPRYLIREDGQINEADIVNYRKHFIKIPGSIDEDNIRQIQPPVISPYSINFLEHKINEIKEVSGNRDVNNGSTGSSVTAASAIAALQEAGNGLSRDMISGSYAAEKEIDELVIELIRQFYDSPREFRITGEDGKPDFVEYTNAGIKPQLQPSIGGIDLGMRLPVFDIEIVPQAESAYTRQAYNELALQLYGIGFFDPQNAEKALMALDMMDFKGKEELRDKISQQQQLMQQLQLFQQMAIQLATKAAPDMVPGLMQAAQLNDQAMMPQGKTPDVPGVASAGTGEHWRVRQARQQAEDGSKPR